MLQSMLNLAKSAQDIFIVYLIIGDFFYAMCSCKYTKTNGKPRTIIVTTDCISFYKKMHNRIQQTTFNDHTASSMRIIFKIQKNMEVEEPVSNHTTNSLLCLVSSWEYILSTLYSQYGVSSNTIPINNFKSYPITASNIS